MKFDKIFQVMAWLTIVLALSLIALVGYWLLFNQTPTVFNNLPHKVLNEKKTVESGGYLIYEVDYCKNNKLLPIITKTFVDGIVYATPEVLATSKEVGCRVDKVQVYVPKALPTGSYTLKTTYRYQINPVRSVDIFTETERFTIVK